jgi:hypothetical protein
MSKRLRRGSARAGGLLMLALAMMAPSQPSDAQATATFSRIDVAGTQRIDPETVRVFAGLEPGVPVTPEEINLAVRRLFASGLFESVEVVPEAGRLVITVVENPTINRIAFEGNRSLDDETLSTASIELRPRLAYSVAAAEADAQRIIDAYRAGRPLRRPGEPVIIRQPDNRVDLVFEITEGRVTPVQRIAFVGNQVFSDTRLRRAIQTGQANSGPRSSGADLRRRPARARPRAPAPVLPRARLHRLPRALGHGRARARAQRLLRDLHGQRGRALRFRHALGRLERARPRRRRLRAAPARDPARAGLQRPSRSSA